MVLRVDRLFRLEAWPGNRDIENGFAARVHDPFWLLARQWQMGEHQGENASTPGKVEFGVREAAIRGTPDEPWNDPALVPAEALVEAEADPWRTMGRRVRAGARLAGNAAVAATEGVRFEDPAPPYDRFDGAVDGLKVWRAQARLGLDAAVFGADAPPPSPPPAWKSRTLAYEARFESAAGGLAVAEHRGGAVDWWSADADGAAEVAPGPRVTAIPAPLEYPGAPHRRFWEIEDARTDIGGYPPEASSFPTMLLVELVYAHGDDWFLFPVRTAAGRVVGLDMVVVTDDPSRGSCHRTTSGCSAPTDSRVARSWAPLTVTGRLRIKLKVTQAEAQKEASVIAALAVLTAAGAIVLPAVVEVAGSEAMLGVLRAGGGHLIKLVPRIIQWVPVPG